MASQQSNIKPFSLHYITLHPPPGGVRKRSDECGVMMCWVIYEMFAANKKNNGTCGGVCLLVLVLVLVYCCYCGTYVCTIIMVIIWIIGPMAEISFFFFQNHQYYSFGQIQDVFQWIDCTNMVSIDRAGLADRRRGHIDISSFFSNDVMTFSVFYASTSTNWMF